MKILFAGGGTAGHIEPALAVARAWRDLHPDDEIFFIGTAAGLENTLVPAAGFTLTAIPKVSIARKISPSLLKVPIDLLRSILVTKRLLKGVDCAIGFGGYVSGPLYLAAALTRTPLVIHEQNAKPGWANKLGARFTSYLAISYPVTSPLFARAELTGLPLRKDVMEVLDSAEGNWKAVRTAAKREVAARYGISPVHPLIFIFGGSQGSQAINSVIYQSLPVFESNGVSVIHGIGAHNQLPQSSATYQPRLYIEDMAQCYLAADLIIARSGAVTCAEVAALGRYALFIPLPIGNGEQELNARDLVSQSRAEILPQREFRASWLTTQIQRLLSQSSTAPIAGSDVDINAASKMVSLMEHALHGGR